MAEASQNSASAAAVPAETLDRVQEALRRSLKYLPATAQQKLAELRDPKTLRALALLLLGWGVSHVVGLGFLGDAVAFLFTIHEGIVVAGELAGAINAARSATTDAQLENAAKLFAASLTDLIIDGVVALLGAAAFKRLRDGIEGVRLRFTGKAGAPAIEVSRVSEPRPGGPKEAEPRPAGTKAAEPRPESRRPVEEPVTRQGPGTTKAAAAAVALGLKSGATTLGQVNPWPWLAGALALLGLLLLVGGALSVRTSKGSLSHG